MKHPVFCFNVVGLSPLLLETLVKMPCFSKLIQKGQKSAMEPVFPCLTLPGQASISTGTYPSHHGIVANGFYYRERCEVSFWDQYRSLVNATPVWETLKEQNPDLKSALLFCQSSLYGQGDIIITPKPMHTDEGLIQWCYSKPPGTYEAVCRDIGRPFNLMDYWGPFASAKASQWIMEAAMSVVKTHQPDFMMVYIPHLDYSCQKFGPDDPRILEDLKIVDDLMADFVGMLENLGIQETTTLCLLSEYSLSRVTGALLPNLTLRDKGFLAVREIEGREYLDFELSRAFAMVDHQVAHVYVKNPHDIQEVKSLLETLDGVSQVLGKKQKKWLKVDHERSGELIAITDPDKWFAYYWWHDSHKAPDFAAHIDIHRKPGYDPLELFMDLKTLKIPQTPELIKGSHGAPAREGEGMAIFMVSGEKSQGLTLPEKISMVEVAPILMRLMNGYNL